MNYMRKDFGTISAYVYMRNEHINTTQLQYMYTRNQRGSFHIIENHESFTAHWVYYIKMKLFLVAYYYLCLLWFLLAFFFSLLFRWRMCYAHRTILIILALYRMALYCMVRQQLDSEIFIMFCFDNVEVIWAYIITRFELWCQCEIYCEL